MAAGKPMRESTGAGFRQVATRTSTRTPTLTPTRTPTPTPTPNPNQVASYLFGQNRPQQALPSGGGEKMSMTAPVRSSEDGKSARLSFVLPSKFSLRTAPRPLDKSVRLRQVQPHYLAARAFSGPPPGERRVLTLTRTLALTVTLTLTLTPTLSRCSGSASVCCAR